MWKLFCKAVKPPVAPKGLYAPPTRSESFYIGVADFKTGSNEPITYKTHIEWAKDQGPIPTATRGLVAAELNPIYHRCRIGKITLKQADRRV